MSIGARPLDARGVRGLIDRKAADFRAGARGIQIRYLHLDAFLESATIDPDVRFEVETGYVQDLEEELRDPVLVNTQERLLLACPPLATRVLADEPPEIHRPFVEGVLYRKLFRFFVPAAHEGGPSWEAVEQVRDVMQRHFALQLVVTETVLGQRAA